MTCREKLRETHPGNVSEEFYGGCLGCPDQYIVIECPDWCKNQRIGDEDLCSKCWDREIPYSDTPVDIEASADAFDHIILYQCDNCSHDEFCKYKDAYIDTRERIRKSLTGNDEFISSIMINCRYHANCCQ